jgi:membrane-bound hydrogenase subunit mbhJ
MSLKLRALCKSPWIFHVNTGACNNCDIELVDALTPRFDVERFGVLLVGSIRHADALVVTGGVTRQAAPRLKRLYEQAPKPRLVIACGTCACTKGIFHDGYHMAGPVDAIVPVDIYVPGCPPKPEAIIDAVVKLLKQVA